MVDIIIILIVILIAIIAIKKSIPHFKGESCCGCNSGSESDELKVYSFTDPYILRVKNMHCNKCAFKIQKALQHIHVKGNVDYKSGIVEIDNNTHVDLTIIKDTIRKEGYEVL